jgi:torulene dioxygenase
LFAKTDVNRVQEIDPVTLEPLGISNYGKLLSSAKGPMAAAHPGIDHDTGEVFNYTLEFGRRGTYHVFSVSENSKSGTCSDS